MSETTSTAEERYRLLLESAIGYAMILLDEGGRITNWNAGAESIMAWAEAEALGQTIELIFTPEDREAGVPAQEMQKAKAEGKSLDLRWHLKKDGSRFFADGLLEVLRDEAGNLRGFAKILRDATDRRRSEEERQNFISLADNSPLFVGMCDLNGVPFYVNDAALRLVGMGSVGHMRQTTLRDYFFPEDQDFILREFIPQVIRDGHGEVQIRFRHFGTGEAVWVIYSVFALTDAQGLPTGLATISRDITDAKRVEEELRGVHQQTERLLDSITDAFFTLDHEYRFTYINRETERILFRTRDELLSHYIWEVFPEGKGSTFDREYRRAVAEGVSVSFEEFYPPLDVWFEVRAYPSEDGISVFFQNVNARKRAETERERLLAETKRRAEREALLNRIGEAIRATTDPEEIQQVAARALGEALRADRCYFSFYDLAADTNWVGQDFRREDLPSLAGRYRLSNFQVNAEDYYPDRQTLVVNDATDDHWSFPEVLLSALRQLRVRSAISVPIFDGGRLVATLSVAMADEPRAWTDDEVQVAETVAAQTRSAVEAARLLAEQQARLQEEALVGRIGVAIRSELDPAVIQETAAALLGEALGVDRCFYLTYELFLDAATVGRDYHRPDLPSLAGEYRLSDFQAMLAEVFAGGATASIPDVRTSLSPAVAQAMDPFGHRAVLAVPFFDEGRLVAALWASADTERAWTAHDAALLEQAATLTRTSLEAARVSRREHTIAQQLQDALQPGMPEYVPGLSVGKFTKAALEEAEVGGDFFDVFPLDKELYALVIGDVSGKGLAAAQQLALIRNSLRTTLYLYREPAQAIAALNTIVTAHDLLVGFVTAFVGVYDASTGQIRFCSCGHEPGLVRRTDGSVEALETTGPPLGVAENANYSELTVTLSSDDTLLLYTDGISEAGPSRRELLGTEGLKRIFGALPAGLEAQAQAAALFAEVSDYTGGIFRDDVAVLLARRL